jgi:hypothetical protein
MLDGAGSIRVSRGLSILNSGSRFCRLVPYSVQVFAIILTLSTFNRGESALAALLGLELSDRASSVPVISTFSPTCPDSLLASASSR